MSLDKNNGSDFIQFWGDKSRFSHNKFQLNTDIAFESWLFATQRWKELNKSKYKFDGVAIENKNSSIEAARDLYLP